MITGKILYSVLGFPISRTRWEQLKLDELIPVRDSVPPPPGVQLFRIVSKTANSVLEKEGAQELLRAGQMMSADILDEAMRHIWNSYVETHGSESVAAALREAQSHETSDASAILELFARQFPVLPRDSSAVRTPTPVDGTLNEAQIMEIRVRELALLALSHENSAMGALVELFPDSALRTDTDYRLLLTSIEDWFKQAAPLEELGLSLFDALRAPMLSSPDSLKGQLQYVRKNWRSMIPDELLSRITLALDVMEEEDRQRIGTGGQPVSDVIRFRRGASDTPYPEYEYPEIAAFSQDANWMSNVVLIAKSTYVWLDQLSRKYARTISTLDQIPDEELDRLAAWGINALWLIGLWKRSYASKTIKQLMGNSEAEASAYSLRAYEIEDNLGGERAFENIKQRAKSRGIRLAGDMVPNHMGIDSTWVLNEPDLFLHADSPPYPNYSYAGVDLSPDPNIGLFIEDGYWSRTDAAVVFKRIDKGSGAVSYIYHGNDGTSMPWNDTAQLNFLSAATREKVIETILHVARKFPVIRFDAAMTLAKKHFQRLWFPRPGDAGAIPSRAEHGMSKEEFDYHFPTEFWREVVDRVSQEAPDTLLLAEAFWLMEGYFVRTLGMHRVYNSAFMNMLKMEENAKYRETVKNVLAFSPQVLKRFVNFMNNPDERTAVEQFGKGDKYFGVATLMVTMPGLPMFGHGQVEGLTEKYGMEFSKAMWDETPDENLVARHVSDLFPLVRLRPLFSEVENFAFYDFVASGGVDENVFAYSNMRGEQKALVLYNNAYASTSGRINESVAMNVKELEGGPLETTTVGRALGLEGASAAFLTCREHRSKLHYLFRREDMVRDGFPSSLYGYECKIFLDFRLLEDADGTLDVLERRMQGRPVADIEKERIGIRLEPLHSAFLAALDLANQLFRATADRHGLPPAEEPSQEWLDTLKRLAGELSAQGGGLIDPPSVAARVQRALEVTAIRFVDLALRVGTRLGGLPNAREQMEPLPLGLSQVPVVLYLLSELSGHSARNPDRFDIQFFDQWRGSGLIAGWANQSLPESELNGNDLSNLVRMLLQLLHPGTGEKLPLSTLASMLGQPHVQEFLGINSYQGEQFLSRERVQALLAWWVLLSHASDVQDAAVAPGKTLSAAGSDELERALERATRLLEGGERGGWRLPQFKAVLETFS